MFHLKYGVADESPAGYAVVGFGAGDIDYTALLDALAGAGRDHGTWEQDNAPTSAVPPFPVDSLGNAERSYEALSSRRGVPGRA